MITSDFSNSVALSSVKKSHIGDSITASLAVSKVSHIKSTASEPLSLIKSKASDTHHQRVAETSFIFSWLLVSSSVPNTESSFCAILVYVIY